MRIRIASLALVLVASLILRAAVYGQEATPATPEDSTVPRVTDQREIAIAGRIISMSPDGAWLAALDTEAGTICAYAMANLEQAPTCAELSEHNVHSVADDYARWSPDGSRLAFTEEGPRYLVDADIWVFTAATGELLNLTHDGIEGGLNILGDDDTPFFMDILPAWSPDGHEIAFSRSAWDGDWHGSQLMRVPSDGSGDPAEIGRVNQETPMTVYFGMEYAPDGTSIYYTVAHPDPDEPDNGVWEVILADGTMRHLAGQVDPERGYPTVQDVSPLGDQVLVYDALFAGQFGATDTAYGLLEIESGNVEPLTASVDDGADLIIPARATLSPDGQWLVFAPLGPAAVDGLTIRPATSASPADDVTFLQAEEDGPGPVANLAWATNGTLFAQNSPNSGLLLSVAGGNEPPALVTPPSDTTPAATPQSASTGGPVDPESVTTGTPLLVNDAIVALRSAPAVDAPVVAELEQGAPVTALGPAETAGGFTWIPVRDDASGTLGYVRAELVSAAGAT